MASHGDASPLKPTALFVATRQVGSERVTLRLKQCSTGLILEREVRLRDDTELTLIIPLANDAGLHSTMTADPYFSVLEVKYDSIRRLCMLYWQATKSR